MQKFLHLIIVLMTFLGVHVQNSWAQETSKSTETTAPYLTETTYWQFQFFLRMNSAKFLREAKITLPRSSMSQDILSLRRFAPEYATNEAIMSDNTVATWKSLAGKNQPNWIIYEAIAKVSPKSKPKKLEPSLNNSNSKNFLELSADDKKRLEQKLVELNLQDKTIGKKVRVLFDYVLNSIERTKDEKRRSFADILEQNQANTDQKIKLFRGFLSVLQIPNRTVTGVSLEDRKIKSRFSRWVQADLNNQWLDFDLLTGFFANLPSNRLVISVGDQSPFAVSNGVVHNVQFVMHRLSEESALDPGDLVIPQKDLLSDEIFNKDVQESQVKNAIGRIAIITEKPISKNIIEKISASAKKSKTKVYFYSAPYESHFFRGSYIAKILTQNFNTISSTDAVFIQSEDDAGLYALFRLSQSNKRLRNTTIFLNGNISEPVGNILGYSLFKLLKPKDLYITPDRMTPEHMWYILEDNVLNGLPIDIVSKRWTTEFQSLADVEISSESLFRQFLIKTWTLAAEAEVNLESIYLILILPIIALVIVIFRNVIGMDTFGTFSPVIVSVAFLTTGVVYGLAIFATIVATGVVFRSLLKNIHIHMVARTAMLIAVVGLTMLVLIIVGVHFNWGALVNASILPMVIMAGMIENFTKTQMELGTREALRLTFNTLIVAILSYLIIDMAGIQSLVLVYPEITLAALLIEILIGRWNGIRLLEYRRFFQIVKPQNEEV